MVRTAYRLWTNENKNDYVELGLTLEEANEVIDYLYSVDEDFTSKKKYISTAKEYAAEVKKELGYTIPYEVLFGEPDEDQGYRYCSKCGAFFWEGEDCDCEYL